MDDLTKDFANINIQPDFYKDIFEKCIYPFEYLSLKYSRTFIYFNWNDLISTVPKCPTISIDILKHNVILIHWNPKIIMTINEYHLTYKRQDELPLSDGTLFQIFNIRSHDGKTVITPLLYEKLL